VGQLPKLDISLLFILKVDENMGLRQGIFLVDAIFRGENGAWKLLGNFGPTSPRTSPTSPTSSSNLQLEYHKS
jgi:hypothetical protein